MQYTLKELKATLKAQIQSSPKAQLKALVKLYNLQTQQEKIGFHTNTTNCVGFTKPDAHILTSIARQHLQGFTLTEKQFKVLFYKIPKYANQLAILAIKDNLYNVIQVSPKRVKYSPKK